MPKACFVLLADTDTHEGMGRMANALTTASEYIEAGDEATLIFDGAGTKWVPVLEDEHHRYHPLYLQLIDHIAGACTYCANAYGVKDQIQNSRVRLLSDFRDHPSLHQYAADGFQIITF